MVIPSNPEKEKGAQCQQRLSLNLPCSPLCVPRTKEVPSTIAQPALSPQLAASCPSTGHGCSGLRPPGRRKLQSLTGLTPSSPGHARLLDPRAWVLPDCAGSRGTCSSCAGLDETLRDRPGKPVVPVTAPVVNIASIFLPTLGNWLLPWKAEPHPMRAAPLPLSCFWSGACG